MSVVEKFNSLNGKTISRKRIESVIDLAKKENNAEIIYRLSKVLRANPSVNSFKFNIEQYPTTRLNAPRHTGSYKEALDNCGRLKPGYKFEKGRVVKIERKKPVKKTAKPKVAVKKQAKPTKKAPASTNAKTPVKPLAKKAVKPTVTRKRKSDPKKQLELFGMNGRKKTTGLKAPVVETVEPVNEPVPVVQQRSRNPRALNIGAAGNDGPASYFTVMGEEGKFLQAVERKPHHSVVITMDGEQGAGKTTTLYKFMNAVASHGNSCLFISGEEHPQSSLAIEKRDKYLSSQAIANTDIVAEVNSMNDLYDLIKDYEIIFIDSWQKLVRMVGAIRLDEDLRKKFNGKVFVIIFQQTTDGRTKGGSEIVFDGDI